MRQGPPTHPCSLANARALMQSKTRGSSNKSAIVGKRCTRRGHRGRPTVETGDLYFKYWELAFGKRESVPRETEGRSMLLRFIEGPCHDIALSNA